MGLIQLHGTDGPSVLSWYLGCPQNLVSRGCSDSAPLHAFICSFAFWKTIIFHLLPPLQTSRSLTCCAGIGQSPELLCLHYKHKNLRSCSSPHPFPDFMPTGFSQVFWHLTMKTSSTSSLSLLKLGVMSPHLDFHCRVLLIELMGLFHT